MYRKLAQYRNQFVCVDSMFGAKVLESSGLLTEVTPEYITMIIYDQQGGPRYEFTMPLTTLLGLSVGRPSEQKLAAEVSLAASIPEI